MVNMTDQQQRVNKLIERIERHQGTLKLSDKRFVARYQEYIGSTKTWRERLILRAWDELGRNLDKWEQNLNKLTAILDGGQEIGDYYEELPIAQYAQTMYDMLQGQSNDRRVVFLIGPTGLALGPDNTLYVSDALKNQIVAIPNATTRTDSAGTGRTGRPIL